MRRHWVARVALVAAPTNVLDPWEAGINYGITPMPVPDGGQPFFDVWTDSIGVFSGTGHPAEAEKFIAFLATEGQRMRVQITGDMPLDSAVAEQMNWAGDIPGRQETLEIVQHARPPIFFPDGWNVIGPLFDESGQIFGGEEVSTGRPGYGGARDQAELGQSLESVGEQG